MSVPSYSIIASCQTASLHLSAFYVNYMPPYLLLNQENFLKLWQNTLVFYSDNCCHVCSYDDSWIGQYAGRGHMMAPPPLRGARFARPPGRTSVGRAGYRSAGECLVYVVLTIISCTENVMS